MLKLDPDEKELLDSVEGGEWISAKGGKRERARYSRYVKATFRKDDGAVEGGLTSHAPIRATQPTPSVNAFRSARHR